MMIITVSTQVSAPIHQVWESWTTPEHIVRWNFASEDWCCSAATNNLRPGGKFVWRMEAKDGSMGFDFEGTYEQVEQDKLISCNMSDGRKVKITFEQKEGMVELVESFDAEDVHSGEQQRQGWQAILENFRKHVESLQ